VKRINTKTGAVMTKVILKVRWDQFRVACFGNVAELSPGRGAGRPERSSVAGTLTVSNWKDETSGEWKNSFGVIIVGGDRIGLPHWRKSVMLRWKRDLPA